MPRNLEELLNFPPEVIVNVLRFVPLKDLCKVVLASNFFRTLASQPKLWRGMRVDKDKLHQEGLPQLFSINRFKQVRKIDLSRRAITTEELLVNLNAITSSVKELNLDGVNVEEVPAEILAQVASNLEIINLHRTWPTPEQNLALMNVCISSSTLMEVDFADAFLDEVPAELLAEAVGNLKKVDLDNAIFTPEQMIAVLKVCISSSSLIHISLRRASLAGDPILSCLSGVPAELLSEAVGHLRSVNLGGNDMTTEQCLGVLKACISSATLTEIDLMEAEYHDHNEVFEGIPDQLLARAASNLQTINLSGCALTTDQYIAVLESTHFSSKLKNVTLEGDNLREVPAELLAQAASQFQTIGFEYSNLTVEQCIALLEAGVSSNKLIQMTFILHDGIPSDLLDRARQTGRISAEHCSTGSKCLLHADP